jgi:hypothetical protein
VSQQQGLRAPNQVMSAEAKLQTRVYRNKQVSRFIPSMINPKNAFQIIRAMSVLFNLNVKIISYMQNKKGSRGLGLECSGVKRAKEIYHS